MEARRPKRNMPVNPAVGVQFGPYASNDSALSSFRADGLTVSGSTFSSSTVPATYISASNVLGQ